MSGRVHDCRDCYTFSLRNGADACVDVVLRERPGTHWLYCSFQIVMTSQAALLIEREKDLTPLTTFGVAASSRWYAEPHDVASLRQLLLHPEEFDLPAQLPLFVMGGGSNLLFTEPFAGLVVRPLMKGIEILSEKGGAVRVRVAAGEVWDHFVAWAVEQRLGGIENLSWIPGHVGAVPVQNIGAYGVEAGQVIERVTVMAREGGRMAEFDAAECQFGYRNSLFKQEGAQKYVVTAVTFRLQRHPLFLLHYHDVKEEVARLGALSLAHIRQAIINIRLRKLPDPARVGNAGSFFKNPEVEASVAETLLQRFPAMPHWAVARGYKLSAAWMIEQAGWKGRAVGQVSTSPTQALVITNLGGATGKEVWAYAEAVQLAVQERFGIQLHPEVLVPRR